MRVLALAMLLAMAAPAVAVAQRSVDYSLPAGSTTIPFELVDNHVALPVMIDGQGPFRFVFDTGGQNVIDADVAKQLGLASRGAGALKGVGDGTEPIRFTTVESLGVGGATLRNQTFAVIPVHAGFGISSSQPVDGLIGYEVLARFVTTFDYGTNTVVLRTAAGAAAAPVTQGTTIPFILKGQRPVVDCEIASFKGSCVLDTGSRIGLSVLSPFLAAHPSIAPADATAVGADGFGIGGAAFGRLGRTTLQLAGYTIPDVIADLSTQKQGAFADPSYAGNVGAGVLKRFAVTFDYAHLTVAFVPDAEFATRDTYDRSGVFLLLQGGQIVVEDVRPGTPAAVAGIVRGNVFAQVDGHDGAVLGLAAIRNLLRGPAGTALNLRLVAKDGTARYVTLTLRDYV
jgi:hypothetical protein